MKNLAVPLFLLMAALPIKSALATEINWKDPQLPQLSSSITWVSADGRLSVDTLNLSGATEQDMKIENRDSCLKLVRAGLQALEADPVVQKDNNDHLNLWKLKKSHLFVTIGSFNVSSEAGGYGTLADDRSYRAPETKADTVRQIKLAIQTNDGVFTNDIDGAYCPEPGVTRAERAAALEIMTGDLRNIIGNLLDWHGTDVEDHRAEVKSRNRAR